MIISLYKVVSIIFLFSILNVKCFRIPKSVKGINFYSSKQINLSKQNINRVSSTFKIMISIGDEKEKLVNPSYCYYFTGAGLYFWWQAGTAKYLQSNNKINKNTTFIGASAGSLTALLLLCNVDFDKAAWRALDLAQKEGIFEKKSGLVGILGNLLRKWLNEIVPDNITAKDLENLYISLTPIGRSPFLVSAFQSKEDVINACLASCHVPLFMDGKPVAEYRGEQVIDGSFWYFVTKDRYAGLPLPLSKLAEANLVWIDYGDDVKFLESVSGNFLETPSNPNAIYKMMERGYNFMKEVSEMKDSKLAIVPVSIASKSFKNTIGRSTIALASSTIIADYIFQLVHS